MSLNANPSPIPASNLHCPGIAYGLLYHCN